MLFVFIICVNHTSSVMFVYTNNNFPWGYSVSLIQNDLIDLHNLSNVSKNIATSCVGIIANSLSLSLSNLLLLGCD